jgi:hypothetical protein
MPEIVQTLERATGKHAIFDVIEKGSTYDIDISPIQTIVKSMSNRFNRDTYLNDVVNKYFRTRIAQWDKLDKFL